jgi:hypothetical protein
MPLYITLQHLLNVLVKWERKKERKTHTLSLSLYCCALFTKLHHSNCCTYVLLWKRPQVIAQQQTLAD